MKDPISVVVIIPALNEEKAIGKVIEEIPKESVNQIVVGDNGSVDRTRDIAIEAGAIVVSEPELGYGAACLKAMAHIKELDRKPDVVVFLDGDYSDHPKELPKLIEPILKNGFDLVIGSRNLGGAEPGSLTPQQVFGNWLATGLLKLIYHVEYTDLGPFRAIRYDALLALEMEDRNYGWTVEMQIKAAKKKMKTCEVSVHYRNRIGQSKVSGTVKGSVMAGYKIIKTLIKYI
jgi:glycosyltransferase involved in cell wall biosynthesis